MAYSAEYYTRKNYLGNYYRQILSQQDNNKFVFEKKEISAIILNITYTGKFLSAIYL